MVRNILYAVCGVGSLALMFFAAPAGLFLTGSPQTGKVTKDAKGKTTTVRGGPAFIWLGGGYHGGK